MEVNEPDINYAIETAIEKERARIKEALHDDTVQRLVAFRLLLDDLLIYQSRESARQMIEQLMDELERTTSSLRFLISNITHPDFERKNLTELIGDLQAKFSRSSFLRIIVREEKPENKYDLNAVEKRELFWIIQEALQNFIKHSLSNQFHIYLNWENGLLLEAEDGGQGLRPGNNPGMGLKSIQARAKNIGAHATIETLVKRGVVIRVKLSPVK